MSLKCNSAPLKGKDCLLEGFATDGLFHPAFGREIDLGSEQFRQALLQAGQSQKGDALARREVGQQIDVGGRTSLAPCDRTEQAQVIHAG